MANHAYISTTSCACWDIDSLNRAAVYASADVDNAVFVKCGKPNVDSSNNIKGYEFPVTLAAAEEEGLWVVNTPEVGASFEMQLLSDPRKFYNEAGKPMSIKYLIPKTDAIEVNAEAFASGALPTSEGFVKITSNGKLIAASSAPATGTYFSVLGFKNVAIGNEMMPVVVLQCEKN